MVGAKVTSFAKYNNVYANEVVCSGPLEQYVETKLMASFKNNLSPRVVTYLHNKLTPQELAPIAQENYSCLVRASILLLLLQPQRTTGLFDVADQARSAITAHPELVTATIQLEHDFAQLADDIKSMEKRMEFNYSLQNLLLLIEGVDVGSYK